MFSHNPPSILHVEVYDSILQIRKLSFMEIKYFAQSYKSTHDRTGVYILASASNSRVISMTPDHFPALQGLVQLSVL